MIKPQRILLASAQEDFEFPLAEAARKQIFALARKLRDDRCDVEILIVTPGRSEQCIQDDIPIREITKSKLLFNGRYCNSFDSIHYFGTIGVVALMIAMLTPSKHKTFTVTDGGVYSTGRRTWLRRRMARWFHRFYDLFQVYTNYQRRVLLAASPHYETKLKRIAPVLDTPLVHRTTDDTRPGILYMGHLSYFKGVDIVLEVFRALSAELPQLRLTIAGNGLKYKDDLECAVRTLADAYPGRVQFKGKVDVYEELRRASLLIYPIRAHDGTFAVPLSLYESLACGTPFLSSRLEGVAEYFDDYFLCEAGNADQFVNKARAFLTEPSGSRQRIEQNLQRITKACEYHAHCY